MGNKFQCICVKDDKIKETRTPEKMLIKKPKKASNKQITKVLNNKVKNQDFSMKKILSNLKVLQNEKSNEIALASAGISSSYAKIIEFEEESEIIVSKIETEIEIVIITDIEIEISSNIQRIKGKNYLIPDSSAFSFEIYKMQRIKSNPMQSINLFSFCPTDVQSYNKTYSKDLLV